MSEDKCKLGGNMWNSKPRQKDNLPIVQLEKDSVEKWAKFR